MAPRPGTNSLACSGCHDPAKGWSDGLARCAGCDRNSISLFNVAYEQRPAWDGFAASLEDHNAAAITFDQDPAELVDELSAVSDYRTRFAQVFGGEIKAGCSSCHVPPLFIDNGFHALGVPQPESVADDPGRYAVTGDERDRAAFRTPTLRNVALTAPYMHNGALRTLDDVVAFYDAGGGTVPGRPGPDIGPLHLTQEERRALVAFLGSLTDPSTDPGAAAVERRP